MKRAEREALELLRRLSRRPGFRSVFSQVVSERQTAPARTHAAWADLEELLAIDLERK